MSRYVSVKKKNIYLPLIYDHWIIEIQFNFYIKNFYSRYLIVKVFTSLQFNGFIYELFILR